MTDDILPIDEHELATGGLPRPSPNVRTPEDLIAAGEMPQIPYEKTSRVPEGWELFLAELVQGLDAFYDFKVTDRLLTLHQGRVEFYTDDPDRPREVKNRIGLFSLTSAEGAEPVWWIVASFGDLSTGLDRGLEELALGSFRTSEKDAREDYEVITGE